MPLQYCQEWSALQVRSSGRGAGAWRRRTVLESHVEGDTKGVRRPACAFSCQTTGLHRHSPCVALSHGHGQDDLAVRMVSLAGSAFFKLPSRPPIAIAYPGTKEPVTRGWILRYMYGGRVRERPAPRPARSDHLRVFGHALLGGHALPEAIRGRRYTLSPGASRGTGRRRWSSRRGPARRRRGIFLP